MKKITLILFTVILTSNIGYSQQEKPWKFFLTLGARPVDKSAEKIYLNYVDESPSMDNLQSEIDIKKGEFSPSLEIGFEYEFPTPIFFKGLFDAHLGQANGIAFDFGAGYSIKSEKVEIRPMVLFSYGNTGIKLGDIYQNDLYIEVNRTQFYSESVSLRLNGKYFLFSPKLEFAFPMKNEELEIRINAGYNMTLSQSTPYLKFRGQDENEEDIDATESISANNVYLRVDDEIIRKPFINLDGISVQFGIAYKF